MWIKHLNFLKTEGIFVEINFRKSKWRLFDTYHPPSQNNNFYFNNVGCALDVYTQKYENILLVGDFNAEEKEVILKDFMELYDLRNLVKENTCFKSVGNPSCVDLFLTNCIRSFQNIKAISTGISDSHKMIITVLKTTSKTAKPREIIYRSYKNYEVMFREDLNQRHACSKNHTEFRDGFLDVLNTHLPLKKKLVCANEVPYMTKALRRAIANRSRLENQYYKYNPVNKGGMGGGKVSYGCIISIKQMKVSGCTKSRLYKKIWKTTKPFFSDKGTGKTDIILIGDNIFQEDHEVAKILNDHFSNAVKALNIDIPSECKNNESTISSDPIDNIISTFASHPSIKLINENVIKGNF